MSCLMESYLGQHLESPISELLSILLNEGGHSTTQDIMDMFLEESPVPTLSLGIDTSGEIHDIVVPLPHHEEVSLLLLVRKAIATLNFLMKDSPAWEELLGGNTNAFTKLSDPAQRTLLATEDLLFKGMMGIRLLTELSPQQEAELDKSLLTELSPQQEAELDKMIYAAKNNPDISVPSPEFLEILSAGRAGKCENPSLNNIIQEICSRFDPTRLDEALTLATELQHLLLEAIPEELHEATEPPSITLSVAEVADLIIKNAEAKTAAKTQPDEPAEPSEK